MHWLPVMPIEPKALMLRPFRASKSGGGSREEPQAVPVASATNEIGPAHGLIHEHKTFAHHGLPLQSAIRWRRRKRG